MNDFEDEDSFDEINKELRKIAGLAKFAGPPLEEKLSAGWVGLARSLKGCDSKRNNRFWAYARKFVEGAICDCVTDWHYRGLKNESRAARKERSEHRPIHVQYNNVENSHDEDNKDSHKRNAIGGWVGADDHERDWDEGGTRLRLSRRLAIIGRRLGVPRGCIGVDENPHTNGGRRPQKIIGTWGFDIPRAAVRDKAPLLPLYRKVRLGDWQGPELPLYLEEHPSSDKHKISAPHRDNAPALGIIGWLAVETDLRAMRRLAQIGRQKYALELAAADRAKYVREHGTPIIPLFEPTAENYSIPVNTHDTAEPPSDRKEAPKPPEHPLVWSERDRFGTWTRRSTLPGELESKTNANSRMAALTIAVDNGDENGKHDNVVRPGGDLHRPHGGDNRDVRQVRRAAG